MKGTVLFLLSSVVALCSALSLEGEQSYNSCLRRSISLAERLDGVNALLEVVPNRFNWED